jgi:predicted RNA-binding Zn ribbon-like protein
VPFQFVAGNLALDYVTTAGDRMTAHAEGLRTGSDLAYWIGEARLLDREVTVSRAELDHARTLREALFGLVTALIGDRPPPRPELVIVNVAASCPPPTPRVDQAGRLRLEGGLPAALSAIARSGIELFGLPDRRLVRWCADEACTRPFVDRSRGGRRRWCGMTGCGDRAKAAAYRERRRGATGRSLPAG